MPSPSPFSLTHYIMIEVRAKGSRGRGAERKVEKAITSPYHDMWSRLHHNPENRSSRSCPLCWYSERRRRMVCICTHFRLLCHETVCFFHIRSIAIATIATSGINKCNCSWDEVCVRVRVCLFVRLTRRWVQGCTSAGRFRMGDRDEKGREWKSS